MSKKPGDGGNAPADYDDDDDYYSLTKEDEVVIERIAKQYRFEWDDVADCYLQCNRDENETINLLYEEYGDDDDDDDDDDGGDDYGDEADSRADSYSKDSVVLALKEKPKPTAAKASTASGGGKANNSKNSNNNSNVVVGDIKSLPSSNNSKLPDSDSNPVSVFTNRFDEISDDDMGDLESSPRSIDHMTVVVAGHVDAGKSTLVGNLLFKSGVVKESEAKKNQKEATAMGKGSFGMAWFADSSASERAHGVTIDIAETYVKTSAREYTILDAPGHRDYIPSMISGTSLADAALFVIPSSKGEYETAVSLKSQTREHAVLLKALGVKYIVIVVNKLDTIECAQVQTRYNQISEDVKSMLLELQFKDKNIFSVPVIGNAGENLVSLSASCTMLSSWYRGKTLMKILDDIPTEVREINRPLRALLTSVADENSKGCDINVKVVQGRLRVNRNIYIAGSSGSSSGRITGKIEKIFRGDGSQVEALYAGESGLIKFQDSMKRKGEELNLRQGFMLYKGLPHVRCCLKIRAIISTLENLSTPIIPGTSFLIYLNGNEVQCRITKLYRMNIMSTAEIKRPKSVGALKTASVRIEFDRHVCIEPFDICRSLGRFALRANGETCAIGICEKTPKLL